MYDSQIQTYIDNKIKQVRKDIAAIKGKNDPARKKSIVEIFKRLDSLKTWCSIFEQFWEYYGWWNKKIKLIIKKIDSG